VKVEVTHASPDAQIGLGLREQECISEKADGALVTESGAYAFTETIC